MSIAIIAAISTNHCIGVNNTLPWHIPEDLKHFKKITTGKTVIMGRKTWESLPEAFRPLPKRKNIVITRQSNFAVPADVETCASLQACIEKHQTDELFIIGGGQLYTEALTIADTLYITEVHQEITQCDTFFPPILDTKWQKVARENFVTHSFVTYKQK